MNVARLLKYSFEDHDYQVENYQWGDQRTDDLNIVLGWNLLPPGTTTAGNYIIYQLEPLNQPVWQEKYKLYKYLFDGALAIWDYSSPNVSILEKKYTDVHHLPLGFHEKLMDVTPMSYPDFDVLFTGNITKHRMDNLKVM